MKIQKILFAALVASITFSFNIISFSGSAPEELIGTWEFVELLDSKGQHIDTLKEKDGYSVPKGPTLIFNKDNTYSSQYTSSNIDNGTWSYDKEKNEVVLKLYWKKPYDDMAKYIMTLGYAKKDKNGDYYDLIPRKVVELSSDKLVLLEKENRSRVFRKSK